jgi:hypothetical protein
MEEFLPIQVCMKVAQPLNEKTHEVMELYSVGFYCIERVFDFFDKLLLLLEKQLRWGILRQSAWSSWE